MATSPGTVDFLLEHSGRAVTARKMFGEYALYRGGKLVALVCDNVLFVKITEAGRNLMVDPVEAAPYPGAKPCFVVSGDAWDEVDWLARLLDVTAAALPDPKPRRAKAGRPKS